MYAQTLSVVRPKTVVRPHLWIRKILPASAAPAGFIHVSSLASYRNVEKRIFLLRETLRLDLEEDVVEVVEYVLSEFDAYAKFMQISMGEVEKQEKLTKHMMLQIDRSLSVVEACMRSKEYSGNKLKA